MTLPLFDAAAGSQARDTGMAIAAENRNEPLFVAQCIAVWIAENRPDRTVTIDDVIGHLASHGYDWKLGNASGSVFRGKMWQDTGRRLKSSRVSNHRREIRVWQLR